MSAQRTKGTAPVRGWIGEQSEPRLGERKSSKAYLILSLPPSKRHFVPFCHLPRQREEQVHQIFGFTGTRSGGLPCPPGVRWLTRLFPAVQKNGKMRTYRRAGACSRRENGGRFTKLFPAIQILKNQNAPLAPSAVRIQSSEGRNQSTEVRSQNTLFAPSDEGAGTVEERHRDWGRDKSELSACYAPFSERREVLSLRLLPAAKPTSLVRGRNGDS